MSASFLFSQDQNRVDSQKFLGSGISGNYMSVGQGDISGVSTLSAYQVHSQGMYCLNTIVDIAGVSSSVTALKYQLWLNDNTKLLENVIDANALNGDGNTVTVSHPVFIPTNGFATASTVIAYNSLADPPLNPGASGNLTFNLTRLC